MGGGPIGPFPHPRCSVCSAFCIESWDNTTPPPGVVTAVTPQFSFSCELAASVEGHGICPSVVVEIALTSQPNELAMSRALLLVLGLASMPISGGSAQVTIAAPRHRGFSIGGGLGYAGTKLSCALCGEEGSRIGGVSGYLRVGYSVTPAFLLGAEVDAWGGSAAPEAGDADSTTAGRFMGSAMAMGYWYPSARMGLYLKAGVGAVYYRVDGDFLTVRTFGGTVGAGFEVPVKDNVSVVPFLNYLDSAEGGLKLNGEDINYNGSISMWQLGIGVTVN